MRKLTAMLLITLFTIFFVIPAYADEIQVVIDGINVVFADQHPVIVDGRTLVPVRGVFEHMNFNVNWNEFTSTVTMTSYDTSVTIRSSDLFFAINESQIFPEVPPQIINGRFMLPLRAVAEAVNVDVEWLEGPRMIVMVSPGLEEIELEPEPEPANNADYFERRVFELTNMERVNSGVAPLRWNDSLAYISRQHSRDMAANNSMSHMGSDGSTPWDRMSRAGIPWEAAAENVAWGQRTAEAVVSAWMDSESHRDNILDPTLRQLGVGFADFYWTQKFTD